MSIKCRLLTIALASCALAAPALGQQESLLDIYERALQSDPAIREAEATYLATAEVKPQARSGLLPDLSLSAGRSHSFNESPTGAVIGGTGQQEAARSTSLRVGPRQLEHRSDANDFRLGRVHDPEAGGQARRARGDGFRGGEAGTVDSRFHDLFQRACRGGQPCVGRRGSRGDRSPARAGAAPLRGGPHRDYRRAAVASRVRRRGGDRDRRAAQLATSQEFLREIIGDIVTDLASPIDDLPLLTPEPASAEQWVQAALQQQSRARVDADRRRHRTGRHRYSTCRAPADPECFGCLRRIDDRPADHDLPLQR